MVYRFKSKYAQDLIMLGADARRVLEIIGKDPGPTAGLTAFERLPHRY